MKKLILLKILIVIIAFGCSNKTKENAVSWSLDIENNILEALKTPNYLFKDSSIVLYANQKLIKVNTKSDKVFWEKGIGKNVHVTHVKDIGKEILVCGFYDNTSYLYFIDYESGQINSIDTFLAVIESLYQIDKSSNFIIYQQDITEEPYFLELSEYNYTTKKSLWKIERMPLFTQPYIDSNCLVFPKTATSASCVNRMSKAPTVFPIDSKDRFALIEKLNKAQKWQLVNLTNGEIDTATTWDFKFEMKEGVFVAKIGDNKLYQVSLNLGSMTPFVELPDNILSGASYETDILLYLDKKKVALVDVLTQKIKFKKLEFEPILGKNAVVLQKERVFYYTKEENTEKKEYKILGEIIN